MTGRRPWSRLPLRARVTATFMLLALASTATVSLVSYGLARRYVLDQRDRLATSQAFSNARLARSLLRAGDPAPELVVDAIRSEAGAQVLLRFNGEWYTSAVALDPGDLPPGMGAMVDGGAAARQRFSNDGVTNLAVGVPLPAVDAVYYEVSPLVELRRTLGILSTSLIVASVVTTLAAAVAGLVVSRRLLRPLHRMSDAAVDIADGELDRRLEEVADADLEPLVESFNHMADAIQVRIEREARFASDVSHELRTPLTTLATTVELTRNRRAEMPERAATAVDLLGAEVDYFQRLVLDLLEISRLDAGVETVEVEEVDLRELLGGIARAYGAPAVVVADGQRCVVMTDRRRIERIVANLLDNAGRYAGGATRIALCRSGDRVSILLEDCGPGVPEADRAHVFERFWRGADARRHTGGTGLGLSLVAEHVRLLGGTIRVEAASSGGARFVVDLPRDGRPRP